MNIEQQWSRGAAWRFSYAALTALCALVLLCAGGLVTSKGAGMAVPDWPTTFGYNMFFFPLSRMAGGVLYEHSHRLLGTLVGLLSTGLMLWLWVAEPRRWLKGAGAMAVILVVVQGLLGGLRVVFGEARLGIPHAVTGQAFFVLLAAIALWSSGYWRGVEAAAAGAPAAALGRVQRAAALLIGVIVAQLVLGAVMRHAHRGLSIPDFPLAYGRVWPGLDAGAMARVNSWRGEALGLPETTPGLILAHLAHRLLAVAAVGAAAVMFARGRRIRGAAGVRWWGLAVLGLVVAQFALGVWTVWSNKAADIATAHMALGSVLLAAVSLTLIVVARLRAGACPSPAEIGCAAAGEAPA